MNRKDFMASLGYEVEDYMFRDAVPNTDEVQKQLYIMAMLIHAHNDEDNNARRSVITQYAKLLQGYPFKSFDITETESEEELEAPESASSDLEEVSVDALVPQVIVPVSTPHWQDKMQTHIKPTPNGFRQPVIDSDNPEYPQYELIKRMT